MIYADDKGPYAKPDEAAQWQHKCMEALNGTALHDYALHWREGYGKRLICCLER